MKQNPKKLTEKAESSPIGIWHAGPI